jgi:hypothetical protein
MEGQIFRGRLSIGKIGRTLLGATDHHAGPRKGWQSDSLCLRAAGHYRGPQTGRSRIPVVSGAQGAAAVLRMCPAGGFDLGAFYPAYETGGDYFDFIAMPTGHLGIAVGDVEGHGFGSALVMALTRGQSRSFATMDLELNEILVWVNRILVKDLEHGHFVTLALARSDVSRRPLIYVGAGQP